MQPGVRRKHVWTLFFISFFGIAMMNTVGIMQAYLFNEILRIPANEQGSLTGTLLVTQELVVICWSVLPVPFPIASAARRYSPPGFAARDRLLPVSAGQRRPGCGDPGAGVLPAVHRLGRGLHQRDAVVGRQRLSRRCQSRQDDCGGICLQWSGYRHLAALRRRAAAALHRDGHGSGRLRAA